MDPSIVITVHYRKRITIPNTITNTLENSYESGHLLWQNRHVALCIQPAQPLVEGVTFSFFLFSGPQPIVCASADEGPAKFAENRNGRAHVLLHARAKQIRISITPLEQDTLPLGWTRVELA